MEELWALHTVEKSLHQPSLLHFNDWLVEKAEAGKMHANTPKSRNQENQASSGRSKTVTKILSSNSIVLYKKTSQQYPPCVVWSCSVFKEKTPTQRAKFAAEQKLCFSGLQLDQTFRQGRNLENPISLIATALTITSFTERKEFTPQET